MKKLVLNILTVAALAIAVTGCKKGAEATTGVAAAVSNVAAATKYKVIPAESMITWTANKLVGGHTGTINVSNGVAKLNGNALVGGNFIFDINTIACTDVTDAVQNGKLVGHLKAADFFDVAKFANASFEITKVEGNNVSGNLTLKGIKKNVTFPAAVSVAGNVLSISSETFTIDRTEWGIQYNSGKFADPAKLGDYLIKDAVELKISLKANKA